MKDINELNVNYEPYLNLQGIDAVPLLFTDPTEIMIEKMKSLDGVLLTGGGNIIGLVPFMRHGMQFFKVDPAESGPYLFKVKAIVDAVKKLNGSGRYFPLYAICLGYETLLITESDYKYPIGFVHQRNTTSKINFTRGKSRLKSLFTASEARDLEATPLMFFYHELGFLSADFLDFENLLDNYVIVAENMVGVYGVEVAAVEHKTLPIFGLQFHPEKTVFEKSPFYNINHSTQAVALSTKFGSVLKRDKSLLGSSRLLKGRKVNDHKYYRVTIKNIGLLDKLELISTNKDILVLKE